MTRSTTLQKPFRFQIQRIDMCVCCALVVVGLSFAFHAIFSSSERLVLIPAFLRESDAAINQQQPKRTVSFLVLIYIFILNSTPTHATLLFLI